jgi:hypothetical protein
MKPRTRKTAKPVKTPKTAATRKPAAKAKANANANANANARKRKPPVVPDGEFECSVTWDDRPPKTTFTLPYLLSDEQVDHVVLFLEEVIAARGRK